MGVRERGEALERAVRDRKGADGGGGGGGGERESAGEEAARRVREGWMRVVDQGPTGMGRLYNVMAVVPVGRGAGGGVVGFGGDVVD